MSLDVVEELAREYYESLSAPPPPRSLPPGPRRRPRFARGGPISPHTVHARPFRSVVRRKLSQKLTAAHSGSRTLRIAEDEPVAVYYEPGAFEELRKLEEAA